MDSYSLTEARVLFELAQVETIEVVDLRRILDLDPGYLSRVLSRFERERLVTRSRSTTDARRQVVALTDAGRATQADLDARSAVSVGNLLDPVPDGGRRRLLGAMAAIQEVLSPGPAPTHGLIVLRQPVPGDLGWIVRRHGELYALSQG
ncbi:MarR family winged helix-turn-helix transcriptional regulator [Micromonospora sp. CA-240977]|uniref:MarR family winged helix-turn-helix transcriptional regulator n=1 Tax=Micromonospora sp. CA-240977 TaxID=3239957 RepID=UPI003D93CF7B